jgi:hypothetical protein
MEQERERPPFRTRRQAAKVETVGLESQLFHQLERSERASYRQVEGTTNQASTESPCRSPTRLDGINPGLTFHQGAPLRGVSHMCVEVANSEPEAAQLASRPAHVTQR